MNDICIYENIISYNIKSLTGKIEEATALRNDDICLAIDAFLVNCSFWYCDNF